METSTGHEVKQRPNAKSADDINSKAEKARVLAARLHRPSAPLTSPEIPTNVLIKIVGFSLLMVVGPISTYFLTLHNVYHGNAVYAAVTAVAATNIIMLLYVYVAYSEKDGDYLKKDPGQKTE